MTTKVPANTLKIGDVIMPPAREVQLWMRRRAKEHNMSESALHLTIVAIIEGKPDKGGRWLSIKTYQNAEWFKDDYRTPEAFPFVFQVRPSSMWPKVA